MIYTSPSEYLTHHTKVDVRSPGEFAVGHIPGSVNIPLFSDKERAEVGTLYKQTGRQEAIDKGFEIAEPKKASLVERARQVSIDGTLAVHCWRGGMRSKHMATLFEMADLKCIVLTGGYKAYREFGRALYTQHQFLTVLAGPTGSGKTDILHALARQGEQVVDLEGLAHHRGSAFGAIGQPPQPTTEHFQNKVSDIFRNFDPQRRVWVESESKSIGRVFIHDALWEKMNAAQVVAISIPPSVRVQRIVQDYGQFPNDALTNAVQRIEKRLGNERMRECVDHILHNRIDLAVPHLLDYYDACYLNSRSKHKKKAAEEISLPGSNVEQWAAQLRKEVS